MSVKSCITLIIIGMLLLSIPVLIYSIKKKNKSILTLDIVCIVYLFILGIILPNILGFGALITYLLSFITGIIYVISIIIYKKKTKKNNDSNEKSNIINVVTIVLIILPIILLSYSFYREYCLIKNSDLIIESNYQNGIITSKTSRYAIAKDFCKEITINLPSLQSNKKNIEYYTYQANFKNDSSEPYEIKSYSDLELKHIDEQMVKKILLDAKNNHGNLNKEYSVFDYVINTATITYFENSGYYYVSLGYDENGNGGMSVVNELMYVNDKYIGELLIQGDIKSVIYMER